jgi:hypothetical protein
LRVAIDETQPLLLGRLYRHRFSRPDRHADGKDTTLYTGRSDSIVGGRGPANELQLTLRDEDITNYLNGTELQTISGTAPSSGSGAGFYADTTIEDNEWRFSKVIVTARTNN